MIEYLVVAQNIQTITIIRNLGLVMGIVMIRDVIVVLTPTVSEMFLPRSILQQMKIVMKTSLHGKNPTVVPFIVIVQMMISPMIDRIAIVVVLECLAYKISPQGSK